MSTTQNSIKYKNIEIVGLSHGNSGRQCQNHVICGQSVKVEDKLLLKEEGIEVFEEITVKQLKELGPF